MFSLTYLICSEFVCRDADTNKMSFINLYETVEAEGFPLLLPNFCITAIFGRALEDSPRPQCTITLNFNDKQLLSNPINVDFQDKRVTRAIIRFQGFGIERPGKLSILLMHEANTLGTNLIEFTQRPPQPVQLTLTTG